MSEDTVKYSSNSIALGDSLIEYSLNIQSNFKDVFNPLISIYSLMSELDADGQSSELVQNMKKQLESIPAAYHIQILRLFVTRFTKQIVPSIRQAPLDKDVISIEDLLMQASREFQNKLRKIPSIFEILYLTVLAGARNVNANQNSEVGELVTLLLNNSSIQVKVLYDFCDKYEDVFGDKLTQGVLPSGSQK